ncbi:MAG: hypothetical protein HY072_07025 [Deltaproteobacteria bacterium]|nr:hypothetical protein [Deltaproteobacteria bacterium]
MGIQVKKAIQELDRALLQEQCSIEIYICGGAALTLLGISTRETGDVDMVAKVVEPALYQASKQVSKKLDYPDGWLNNKVNPIIEQLPANWQKTATKVFEGKSLTVYSLSRQNLINLKLHACVELRAFDYLDLLALAPKLAELKKARRYCLKQKKIDSSKGESKDSYKIWVNGFINLLKKELEL